MAKVFLRHPDQPWPGLLVCDSSRWSGNGSNGLTWALVCWRGILASFCGGPFQVIYEPLYEMYEPDPSDCSHYEYDWDDPDETAEDRKKRLNAPAVSELDAYSLVSFGSDPSPYQGWLGPYDPHFQCSSVALPGRFRNPLLLTEFVNGRSRQDIIAVSRKILIHYDTESEADWIEKRRNNQGVASNFDILATAARDYHENRQVIRQLRSWTEDQYAEVENAIAMMSAIWPMFLAGELKFISTKNRSWIEVGQGVDRPLLFERENLRIRNSFSKLLNVLCELDSFRSMTCAFDLSKAGRVAFDGKSGAVTRQIVHASLPSEGQKMAAVWKLTERLVELGFDRESISRAVENPLDFGKLVDPRSEYNFILLEKAPSTSEVGPAPQVHTRYGRDGNNFETRPDRLYSSIGGDGRNDVYMSDGLWLSADGRISDTGR